MGSNQRSADGPASGGHRFTYRDAIDAGMLDNPDRQGPYSATIVSDGQVSHYQYGAGTNHTQAEINRRIAAAPYEISSKAQAKISAARERAPISPREVFNILKEFGI